MAKRVNDTEHAELIRRVIAEIDGTFLMVRADHIGWPEGAPVVVGRHTPDLSGYRIKLNSSRTVLGKTIFEVETADSISQSHTADQWRDFSKWAVQEDGRDFIVVVPRGSREEAIQRAQQLDVFVSEIWER